MLFSNPFVVLQGLGGAVLMQRCAGDQAAKDAELTAVKRRVEAALGAGLSEKRLADLISLAQFQMVSRDARAFRSPTVILSMRPQRSVTMRCAPACYPCSLSLHNPGLLILQPAMLHYLDAH